MLTFQPHIKLLYVITGCVLLFVLSSSAFKTHAQQTGEWLSVEIDIDLPKGFSFDVEGEARFHNKAGIFANKYLVDLGLDYKINGRWDLSAGYRYYLMPEDNDRFYPRHRFSFDVDYDNSYGRLGYSLRSRVQRKYRTYIEDHTDAIPINDWRNRIKFTYDIKKTPIEPYIQHEIWLPLNQHIPFRMLQRRSIAGVELPFGDQHEIDLGIMYEREVYPGSDQYLVLLLGYAFSID